MAQMDDFVLLEGDLSRRKPVGRCFMVAGVISIGVPLALLRIYGGIGQEQQYEGSRGNCEAFYLRHGVLHDDIPQTWTEGRQEFRNVCEEKGFDASGCSYIEDYAFEGKPDEDDMSADADFCMQLEELAVAIEQRNGTLDQSQNAEAVALVASTAKFVDNGTLSAKSPISLYYSSRRRSFSSSPRRRSFSSSPRRRSFSFSPRRRSFSSFGSRRRYMSSFPRRRGYNEYNGGSSFPRRRGYNGYNGGYNNGGGYGGYQGGGGGGGFFGFLSTLMILIFCCVCGIPLLCFFGFCECLSGMFNSGGGSGGGAGGEARSSYQPPVAPQNNCPLNEGLARRFLDAARREYVEGQGGSVGDFLDSSGCNEDEGRTFCSAEDRIRESGDPELAINEIKMEWGL